MDTIDFSKFSEHMEHMIVETANRVFNEYLYKNKTIKEWRDAISEPKTHGDSVRAMTDDELAWFFAKKVASCYGCKVSITEDCAKCWYDWLVQDLEKDGE